MLTLSHLEECYQWAFRYARSNEPALLAYSPIALLNTEVCEVAGDCKLTGLDPILFVSPTLSDEEWLTWHTFNYCPTIKLVHLPNERYDILTYSRVEP